MNLDGGFDEEELIENAELRQAVEHLVETAAVSVWSGIVEDLKDLCLHFQMLVEFLFPILLDYQADPSRIGQDLARVLLYLFLLGLAFLVLAPRSFNSSKSYKSSSSIGSSHVHESTSPGSFSSSWLSRHRSNSDQEDADSIEETDEERFERVYEPGISESDYRYLVLPPSCRRVKSLPPPKRPKEIRPEDLPTDEEDHPLLRFQNYMRNVFILIRSLISYDYAGAAWTVITWLQGIRQRRNKNINPDVDQQQEDASVMDDDTTRSISVMTVDSGSPRRSSCNGKHLPGATAQPPLSIAPPPFFLGDEEKKLSAVEEDGDSAEKNSIPHLGMSASNHLHGEQHVDCSENNDTADCLPRRLTRELNSASGSSCTDGESMDPLPRTSSSSVGLLSAGLQAAPTVFYETVESKDSLRRLVVEVAVPDRHGYILGDEFLPDSKYTPLLVFINSRSGPQQGHLLITQLRRLLNPIQIWDLADGQPEPILESFLVLTRLRILVCGGDGTVSWIISALERMKLKRKWPPIAILPLGTGNDLARIHGWGGGYNNESLIGILKQISESYISMLDLWEVTISHRTMRKQKTEVKNFMNYLGVGVDAQAALQVHYLRNSRPEWFFSRLMNKAWYGIFGAEDIIKATSVNVRKDVKLIADGVEIPLPSDSQGIILLNIDSYAGGVPLWSYGVKAELRTPFRNNNRMQRRSVSMSHLSRHPPRRSSSLDSADEMSQYLSESERFARVTACDLPSSCQDGLLDVVSIRGAFHLGQIKVGLGNAQRLCQCREATIIIKNKVAVQTDGEPWRQHKCTLHISRKKNLATMLHRSQDDGGVETEMSKLLDWAEERDLIDGQVHSILLKEFSRRIESKTRQRRVRATTRGVMSTSM